MKFLFITFMILGSFSAYADETSEMLNYEEFMSLTPQQQTKYLKSVQKILASMTQKSSIMAENGKILSHRLPASVEKNEDAESTQTADEAYLKQSQKNSSNQVDAEEFIDSKGSGYKVVKEKAASSSSTASQTTTSSSPIAYVTPSADATKASTTVDFSKTQPPRPPAPPSGDGARPPRPPAESEPGRRPPPRENTASAEQSKPKAQASAASKPSSSEEGSTTPSPSRVATTETPSSSPTTGADKKVTSSNQAPQEKSKEEAKQKIVQDDKKPKSSSTAIIEESYEEANPSFRCMHSGWVIKKEPCRGPNTFPKGFVIPDLDTSKMKCSSGKTMCNPLVFGLKLPDTCKKLADCPKEAKPICVSSYDWPTVQCYSLSTMKDVAVAADILRQNKNLFVQYKSNFDQLCDDEHIKKNTFLDPKNRRNKKVSAEAVAQDIRTTCAWANTQFKLVREAMAVGDQDRSAWAEAHTKAKTHENKGQDRCKGEEYCMKFNGSEKTQDAPKDKPKKTPKLQAPPKENGNAQE